MSKTETVKEIKSLLWEIDKGDGKFSYHQHYRINWLIAEYLDLVPEHKIMEIGWDYDWFRRKDEYILWKATDSEGRAVTTWKPKEYTTSVDEGLILAEYLGLKVYLNGNYHDSAWYGMVVREVTNNDEIFPLVTSAGTYAQTAALALTHAIVMTFNDNV